MEFCADCGAGFDSLLLRCEKCDATLLVKAREYPTQVPQLPANLQQLRVEIPELYKPLIQERDHAVEQDRRAKHEWACPKCGGAMRLIQDPMCPGCSSRTVVLKKVLMHWD
jgi:DNA-directed RNA polymerase subunit RPC12/RpoP